MLVYALIGVALLLWLSVESGFIAPPMAATLIQIRSGIVRLERGSVSASVLEDIASILRESAVSEGYIAITSGNRVTFSRLIPAEIHQRLRNVLLNRLR
jgi:hypothetical protein